MAAGARFDTVAIVGMGLIGGSLGLALRERQLARRVVGVVRRDETARAAEARGACDRATLDPADGTRGADLVVMAAAVLAIPPLVAAIRGSLAPGAVLTDVGSTKEYLESVLPPLLPPGVVYVGGHPMAGSEQAGIDAARADLFEGALYILTRPPGTGAAPVERLADLARGLGARPVVLGAGEHDTAVGRISHLPHVAAAALATAAVAGADPETLALLAAGGFRDTTRIAASPPELWRDICLTNRGPVLAALEQFEAVLRGFRTAIAAEDGAALLELFREGQAARAAVMEREP